MRFTHFSHFLALLVDFNQGKHKPKWTFSFRSEKERKKASFLKMLKGALLDPADHEKRGTSVKNDALAVLTTFSKKFLKYFREKSPFAFLYFSLGKSWILEGQNRQNASWTKKSTFRSFSLRNGNVHLGLCFPWLKSTKSAKMSTWALLEQP